MSAQRQAIFWLLAALLLIGFLALLGDILLPFVLGAGIAYLLDPVADRLQRLGLSRFWATVIIALALAVVLIVGLLFLVPVLVNQFAGLISGLPAYLQSARDAIAARVQDLVWTMGEQANRQLEQAAANFLQKITGSVGTFLGSLWSGGMALVNTVALLVVTPVVAFYLLNDWDRMVGKIDSWLPRDHVETVRRLAREIDDVLAGFVRGQFMILMFLGVFYAIGLTLIGLNFGLLIGVIAGLISFIPYLGPIVGYIIGGIVAGVQFGTDWVPIAGVLGVFVAGQVIEGNFLSPLIVGERVGLHPVWLIFSLFVFAYLLGFVGMLLAVPIAAAIGVLVRFALQQYLRSPLYYGDSNRQRKRSVKSKDA